MKKAVTSGMVVLLLLLCNVGWSFADQGYGTRPDYGYGQGAANSYGPGPNYNNGQAAGYGYNRGNGTRLLHNILDGIPFDYTGDVVSCGIPGNGMVLATEGGNVIIYGIGPIRYWESLGVDRPGVGETVTVSGYTVSYNGIECNIAMTFIIDSEDIVQLRDPETGLPLWRRGPSR